MNNPAALFEVLIANILQLSDTIICNFYITKNLSTSLKRLHGQSMLADSLILVKCSIINTQFLFVKKKHLVIGQFSFSLFFIGHQSPSFGKPHMSAVFFAKTTESYEVCR